ncbi:MAG: hypothetical protein PHR51_02465 [Patescibacteria group bacterium]|nr:hypothetical protein [Patescibacteria group bacterium]
MKDIAKKLTGMIILVGLLLGMTTSSTFAVMPPEGEGIHKIYVDNLTGNDNNDGSKKHPYKTIDWAFHIMNASGAPCVEMYIKGTGTPYETSNGLGIKRDTVTIQQWNGRPLISGVVPEGAWHLNRVAMDSQGGITIKNIDLSNINFDAYTSSYQGNPSYDITLQNLTFKIERTDLLGDEPVVWFHERGATQYGQRSLFNVKIDQVKIALPADAKGGYDAIRLENVDGAQVYRSRFYSPVWDAGIVVHNSANVKLAQNTFPDANGVKMALYKFDETDDTVVYNQMQ